MARRQNRWAAKVRVALIEEMGGKCVDCGETDTKELEFEHPQGRDWEPRKKSYSARMSIYRREWKAGLIVLCCADCNKKRRKTNDAGAFVKTKDSVEKTDNIPF